jgi:uncharacterized protein involved in exopolysaccharide biosynthesis
MQDKNLNIIQSKEMQIFQEDEINVLEYLKVIFKYKLMIFIIVTITCIVSIFYARSLPNIFTATTTILPPHKEGGGGMFESKLGSLGALLGMGQSGGTTELWIGLMKNDIVTDAVIKRLDFMNLYKIKLLSDAEGMLRRRIVVPTPEKDGIIKISIDDTDPKMAALLANTFVEELDKCNKQLNITSSRRTRIFLEGRLKDAKKELDQAEESVKYFEENNKAINLAAQSMSAVQRVGGLSLKYMEKEAELQTLLSYTTENNPQAQILMSQISGLKQQMKELQKGGKDKDLYDIPTSVIPDLKLQYLRLLRISKVQESVYELLTGQYEAARIQEAKDTPTVQVLTEARVPERKSKPNRTMIVLVGTFSAFIFAVFLAFLLAYLKRDKDSHTGVD